jgi:hypothetical protein
MRRDPKGAYALQVFWLKIALERLNAVRSSAFQTAGEIAEATALSHGSQRYPVTAVCRARWRILSRLLSNGIPPEVCTLHRRQLV